MKKLIINADDFGMCEGVTRGIIQCHREGVLTSTTLMTNMPYAAKALEMAEQYPNLGVGIHLVLTCGRPLTLGKKSFTDENGDFKKLNTYPDKKAIVDPNELYEEWHAQIELFIQLSGKKPTHIDSHHHTHLEPGNIEVAARLAKEYDLPMRLTEDIQHHYEFAPLIRGFNGELKDFIQFCEEHLNKEGIQEMMCHPGFIDDHLYNNSSYAIPRIFEMKFIRSPEFKQWLNDHDIELINFSDIKKR